MVLTAAIAGQVLFSVHSARTTGPRPAIRRRTHCAIGNAPGEPPAELKIPAFTPQAMEDQKGLGARCGYAGRENKFRRPSTRRTICFANTTSPPDTEQLVQEEIKLTIPFQYRNYSGSDGVITVRHLFSHTSRELGAIRIRQRFGDWKGGPKATEIVGNFDRQHHRPSRMMRTRDFPNWSGKIPSAASRAEEDE